MPDHTLEMSAEEASAVAVHKARSAAQAVEVSREVALQKVVEETAIRTRESVLSALQEVFGESDSENPQQMKVLVRRIPILCTNVEKMHADIGDLKNIAATNRENIAGINDNLKWVVRLALGAMITGIIAFVFFK